MKNIERIIIGAIAVLFLYWGCDYRHKASKYEGMYNKNDFIITYLIDNNKVDLKDIKTSL